MKLSGIHHACEWRETIRLMMFWDLFCIYWIMKISLEEFLHKFNTTFPPAIVGIPTNCFVDRYYLWSTIPKAGWLYWYGFTKQANILWFDRGGWREGGGGIYLLSPSSKHFKDANCVNKHQDHFFQFLGWYIYLYHDIVWKKQIGMSEE